MRPDGYLRALVGPEIGRGGTVEPLVFTHPPPLRPRVGAGGLDAGCFEHGAHPVPELVGHRRRSTPLAQRVKGRLGAHHGAPELLADRVTRYVAAGGADAGEREAERSRRGGHGLSELRG